MNLNETLSQMEQLGTEANRRIYRNHGAQEPLYGLSTPNLKALAKTIKKDHALAQALWNTGNYDAQILATMIADPREMSATLIDAWIQSMNCHVLADYLSELLIKTPFAEAKAREWMNSEDESIGRAGWHLIGKMAADRTLSDGELELVLPVIESEIHTRLNRTRQGMLNALIAIGGRGGSIMEKALESVARIGPVEIDHGPTGCETPDAAAHIRRAVERAEKKAAKTPVVS